MLLMLITYPLGQSMQIYIDLLFFCWPPEGVSACSYASRPGQMTLCLAAIQTCFIYIPTTSASFSPDTWLEPSVSAQMREGLLLWSISLPVPKWQIDCKHAASCHFHTSTPLLSLCVWLTHSQSFSPAPFLFLALRGFSYTLHAQTVAQLTALRTGLWSQIKGMCAMVWALV